MLVPICGNKIKIEIKWCAYFLLLFFTLEHGRKLASSMLSDSEKILCNHWFWQFSMNLWEKHRKKLQSGSLGILNLERRLRLHVIQWRHVWLILSTELFLSCVLSYMLTSGSSFYILSQTFPNVSGIRQKYAWQTDDTIFLIFQWSGGYP